MCWSLLLSSCNSHSFLLLLFQAAGMKKRRRRRRGHQEEEEEEVCTWMSSWILTRHLTVDSAWRILTLWSMTWTESWQNRSTSVCRGGGGERGGGGRWGKGRRRGRWGGGGGGLFISLPHWIKLSLNSKCLFHNVNISEFNFTLRFRLN